MTNDRGGAGRGILCVFHYRSKHSINLQRYGPSHCPDRSLSHDAPLQHDPVTSGGSCSSVHDSTSNSTQRPLWPFAACLIAVALSWAVVYPFWPYRTRLVDQGKIVDYSWLAFGMWIVGLGLWLWCMGMLFQGLRGQTFSQNRMLVGGTSAAMLAASIAMYPTNAIDVFIYAARSRLLSEYGENPNAVPPIVHWDADPYMAYASKEWSDNLSPYAPLWNQIAAPITWLGGDSIAAAVIGFKMLSAISAIAIAWLVYDILRARNPEWALVAALFWLWNPLVIWDGIGNAHNDVILMLPVVAAFWAWQRRHDSWVVPLLLASVLIKYVTIILIPIAVVALWRRNREWSERIGGILLAAASAFFLIGFSLFPFYDLDAIEVSAREQGVKVAASLAWVVMASIGEWDLGRVTVESVRNVAYIIVSAIIAIWMVACWRNPGRLLVAAFEVMFAFMLIASTNQRAWYVIWLVPLAAILIPSMQWRRALLWSVTSMCGHACTIWLWSVWDFKAWGYYWYTMIIVGVVFLPVLALTAWEATTLIRQQRAESGKLVTLPAMD